MTQSLQNDLLLRVVEGKPVERPPVWMMRQAGRTLHEYKTVQVEAGGFRQLIAQPELAAEVTIQPVDILGVDAAIIFSDILVIPEAMGLPYQMLPGKGPHFPETITTPSGLDRLHPVAETGNLNQTYDAIGITRKRLAGRVPVIGFAGAPWTIFCYMTEGGGSKSFSVAKALMYRDPAFTHRLLQLITDGTIVYLKGQIAAGVSIVQIFDSWAGVLDAATYRTFCMPYLRQICDAIREVPKIVFAKGAFFAADDLASLSCEVLGLDWQMDPALWHAKAPEKVLQGNLDPCVLYATPETVADAARNMITAFPPGRHIANLGHGLNPDTPREHLFAFVETIKGYRYS